MTEQPTPIDLTDDARTAPEHDLEYDLAQEAARNRDEGRHRAEPTVITLPEPDATDSGGDYGYDLARDVPRSH